MWLRREIIRKTSGRSADQSARAIGAQSTAAHEPCAAILDPENRSGSGAGAAPRHASAGATAGMNSDLQKLADACNKAADHYCQNPQTAGPETVIDIYRAMAALASMLDQQRREVPCLPQKKLH